jgi:ribosomal-protein-alanine N-acetyltransferase
LQVLPVLRGDDVLLRPLTAADAEVVFRLFSDPAVVRFMSIPRLATHEDAQAFIASIDRDVMAGSLYQWGIELDGALVGTCTLAAIDRQSGKAEVGFAVFPDLHRRGIASRAVPVMIDFAFERLGLRRLHADADPSNSASIRTLEKIGFRRDGEIPNSILFDLARDAWRELEP